MTGRRFNFWEWLEAFGALIGFEISLQLFGLQRIGQALERMSVHEKITAADPRVRRLTNIVERVAGFLPFKTACLHQCLALCWMLRRRGMMADLVMGVYKFPFTAHVWLACESEIIHWRAGLGSCTGLNMLQAMSVILRIGSQKSIRPARRNTS